MKKENLLKNILFKSTIGFPIGVTLLIISYISIYFLTDEFVFTTELYQIHNINTLILQTLFAGISGYLFLTSLYIFSFLQTNLSEERLIVKNPYKIIFVTIPSSFALLFITMLILSSNKIFSENISTLNLVLLIIILAFATVIFCIKTTIERNMIKKINKKISENNNI